MSTVTIIQVVQKITRFVANFNNLLKKYWYVSLYCTFRVEFKLFKKLHLIDIGQLVTSIMMNRTLNTHQ